MPRLYADYVVLAGLDDDLGKIAGSFVDRAERLNAGIGEAITPFRKDTAAKVAALRKQALQFSEAVSRELAAEMRRKRIAPPAASLS
jgi:hypothetical protein